MNEIRIEQNAIDYERAVQALLKARRIEDEDEPPYVSPFDDPEEASE